MKTQEELVKFTKILVEGEIDSIADNSFIPKFVWYDADDQVQLFMFPQIDSPYGRNKIAWALKLLTAAQADNDALIFMMDSYRALPHPVTGEMTMLDGSKWGPGGMQDAVEKGLPDAVLCGEEINLTVAYRDGNIHMVSVPYERHDNQIDVNYDGIKFIAHEGKQSSLGGTFPTMMQAAHMTTKIIEVMRTDPDAKEQFEQFRLDEREASLRLLVSVMHMVMKETRWPCAIPVHDDEEAAILEDSMSHFQDMGIHRQNIDPEEE